MKKVVIHKPGGYEQLVLEEHADLQPGPDEILMRSHAAISITDN